MKRTDKAQYTGLERKLSRQANYWRNRLRRGALTEELRTEVEHHLRVVEEELRSSMRSRGKDYDRILFVYQEASRHAREKSSENKRSKVVCSVCRSMKKSTNHSGAHFPSSHVFGDMRVFINPDYKVVLEEKQ